MAKEQIVGITYGDVRYVAAEQKMPPPKSRRQQIAEWLAFLRSAMLNGLLIISLTVIVVLTIKDLLRKPVVIEAIIMPEILEKQGYTGDFAAQRLWQAMLEIQEASGTLKAHTALLPESLQLDIVEPSSGLSLRIVTSMLREFLGLSQTRIAGEVTCVKPDCNWKELTLRLRVFTQKGVKPASAGRIGEGSDSDYFTASAADLMMQVDPYTLASYYYVHSGKSLEGLEIAETLVRTGHPQRAWAANFLGNRARILSDQEVAIDWYKKSVAFALQEKEIDFALPWYGWGNSLSVLGRHDEAIEKYRKATEIDRGFAAPWNNWGNSLGTLGRHEEAIEKYLRATKIDPEYASPWINWGNRLSDLGRYDEAIEKYLRATQIDPESALAWNNWGITIASLPATEPGSECTNLADNGQPYLIMAGERAPAWLRLEMQKLNAKCG